MQHLWLTIRARIVIVIDVASGLALTLSKKYFIIKNIFLIDNTMQTMLF